MDITRNNYEEFFILYMDNELSAEDRLRVEHFANANPDLREELDMLLQSRFTPDAEILFTDKDSLLKTSDTILINEASYEEWLLSYVDNELDTLQRVKVEAFAAANPSVSQQLGLFQQTKMEAEQDIVFPNKELLYRSEEEERPVIFMNWKRIAVAAAILLALGVPAYLLINNNKSVAEKDLANTTKGVKPVKAVDETAPAKKVIDATEESRNSNDPKEELAVATDTKHEQEVSKNTSKENSTGKEVIVPVKEKKDEIANNEVKKNGNGLPQPKFNPYVNDNVDANNPIAKLDRPTREALTTQNDFNTSSGVTPDTRGSLNNIIAVSSPIVTPSGGEDQISESEPGRKNKLRGFFRKITRTFEKTTNIKATDDEDRLLVGGLAIRL